MEIAAAVPSPARILSCLQVLVDPSRVLALPFIRILPVRGRRWEMSKRCKFERRKEKVQIFSLFFQTRSVEDNETRNVMETESSSSCMAQTVHWGAGVSEGRLRFCQSVSISQTSWHIDKFFRIAWFYARKGNLLFSIQISKGNLIKMCPWNSKRVVTKKALILGSSVHLCGRSAEHPDSNSRDANTHQDYRHPH